MQSKESIEENVPSIRMERDVKLSVDWSNFANRLTEVVSQGFLTVIGGDGISSALAALMGAAGSIKIDSPPGEKAWALAILCFAWSLDEMKSLPDVDVEKIRDVMHSTIDSAKKRVDSNNETVPATFLDRPTTLPLYQILRDSIIEQKSFFRSGSTESNEVLEARLNNSYERAMFEIFSRRVDMYRSLAEALNAPGREATERQLNWSAYRKRLSNEFHVKPVFGQEISKISLSQLYVPLRAVWPKDPENSDAKLGMSLKDTNNICMFESHVYDWLAINDETNNVIVVGGGPGSGKSTSLKSIVAKVSEMPDWHCLFIPLQHLNLEGDLRENINKYFTDRSGGPFTQAPLSRAAIEDGPPLLLVFDGLDELSRPGEAANEVVSLFATKLASLLAALRGDGAKKIKAIASGRVPAFQAAKRYLSPPPSGCLEVFGYTPADTEPSDDDGDLWDLDQRNDWWQQFAKLTGDNVELPAAFSSSQLRGITHEPLLCYLLVLSGFATSNWESAAENPNRIYQALIDSVWNRGWGDGLQKRQGAGRTLSKTDFNLLMQTIALAAWQGGDTRVASETGFRSAISIARVQEAWENFKTDNGADVTNLAMNFYLKSAEGSHRGFEFTHKSFGDYLAARAVLEVALDLPVLINRNVDYAMNDWLQATGKGALSREILTFLRDEVRLRFSESRKNFTQTDLLKFKAAFERLINAILVDGLPAGNGAVSWRVAESHQRNAETMAWAIMNGIVLALAPAVTGVSVDIDWPDRESSFHSLLQRIGRVNNLDNPAVKCFSYVQAPETNLFGLSLMTIDLRGANLRNANLSGSHLIDANLENADLSGAMLERAMLDRTSLINANLTTANLVDARLERTQWEGADLSDAIISEASLVYADLNFFDKISDILVYRPSFGLSPTMRKRFNKLDNKIIQILKKAKGGPAEELRSSDEVSE